MGEFMTLGQMRTLFGAYVSDPLFGYFTPTLTLTILNNALIQSQRRLLKMHAAYYSICTSTSCVLGQAQYELPDDFLAMFDIWITLQDGTASESTFPLKPISLAQRHEYNQITNTQPTHFYMLQNSLNIVGPPDSTYPLEIIYAYRVPAMVDDSDTADIPEQFHEYVVLLAAQTALMMDDRVSSLVDNKVKFYDELIAANEQRVLSAPRFIIEVS